MKRNTYKISINGIEVARKNAWNSALREMRNQIRIAIPHGTAEMVAKKIHKVGEKGTFLWLSGNIEYPVAIERVKLPVWIFEIYDESGVWGQTRIEAETLELATKEVKKEIKDILKYGDELEAKTSGFKLVK